MRKYLRSLDRRAKEVALRLEANRRNFRPQELQRTTDWIPGQYQTYLNSVQWIVKRASIFKKRGRICEACGFRGNVTVHHLTYASLGHELDSHLIVLCWDCHKKRHPEKNLW